MDMEDEGTNGGEEKITLCSELQRLTNFSPGLKLSRSFQATQPSEWLGKQLY